MYSMITVEQQLRDLLEAAIKESLARPGYRRDPQEYSSGELLVVANLLSSYFRHHRNIGGTRNRRRSL